MPLDSTTSCILSLHDCHALAMRFSGNGCQPCKNSRKKCDGQKPACRRCVRSGKICHSYQEAFSIIHAEDMYASRQLKRPRGPRPKPEPETGINAGLLRNVNSEALAYYMRFHFRPPDGQSVLSVKIQEAMLSTWASAPALSSAMSCLSLVIFSKVKGHPPAAKQASFNYQRSLHALKVALPGRGETNIDACLLTIYFLARYEDSVHDPSSNTKFVHFRSRPHLDGMKACLEYWRNHLRGFQGDKCVVTYCRRALRKAALLGQFDMPVWLHDGAIFGEHGFDLELDRVIVRLITLSCKISSLQKDDVLTQVSLPTLETLDVEAQAIDRAILRWMNLCLGVGPGNHDAWTRTGRYYPQGLSHQTDLTTALRAQCCGYRILANHLQACIFDLMSTHSGTTMPAERYLGCQHVVDVLAYDLVSAVLLCFDGPIISNDLDLFSNSITTVENRTLMPHIAEVIAAPLVIASSTRHVDKTYARWFRAQLANIGRLTGYGIMESAASSLGFHETISLQG